MSYNTLLRHRVRPRLEPQDQPQIDSEEIPTSISSEERDGEVDSAEDDYCVSGGNPEDRKVSDPSLEFDAPDDDALPVNVNNISFGALAKAQALLGKRKHPTSTHNQDSKVLNDLHRGHRDSDNQDKYSGRTPQAVSRPLRTSKHAPAVQSSKHAVSRKRAVIESSSLKKPRDPRFDQHLLDHRTHSTTNSSSSKAYAFLSQYRDSEMATLRKQIQKTKDADTKLELRKTLMSMENRRKAAESEELQREILRRHRKKEQELIQEGKKERPWFLKRGDLKKEALVEQFKKMKGKEAERAIAKRSKRKASREKKGMPLERRITEGLSADSAEIKQEVFHAFVEH